MQSMVQSVYHSQQTVGKHAHFHDCHQIILVAKGEVEFCVNDRRFFAKGGDVAIFSRYENHSVKVFSDCYERYVLHIDPEIINRQSHVYSLLTDRPLGFCNVIDVRADFCEITDIFKRILKEHGSSVQFSDEMEQIAIKQLLITINRCMPTGLDQTYDSVVTDIKRKFENEYYKRYTLGELAKEYSISVSSLSHRFCEVTGVPVMSYLQLCRIAQAKQMLVSTKYSIGQIVEYCGFSDGSNFSRTFRDIVGMSPSSFRKKYI